LNKEMSTEMTNPTARAIASCAASAACGAIGWAQPMASFFAIVGVIVSVSLIWKNA
jgi:hypothetical protein